MCHPIARERLYNLTYYQGEVCAVVCNMLGMLRSDLVRCPPFCVDLLHGFRIEARVRDSNPVRKFAI